MQTKYNFLKIINSWDELEYNIVKAYNFYFIKQNILCEEESIVVIKILNGVTRDTKVPEFQSIILIVKTEFKKLKKP